MDDETDLKWIQLFQLYVDERLEEDQANELNEGLRSDQQVRETFVEFCLHSQLLKETLAERKELDPPIAQLNPKFSSSTRFRVTLLASLVAATLLIAMGIWMNWPADEKGGGGQPTVAAAWSIVPSGEAKYFRLAPDVIRLDQGELFVESTPGQSNHTLKILTPAGEASARGTSFYIGAHRSFDEKENEMNHSLTRIYVLGGMVTLLTSVGSVDGIQGELLTARADQMPEKLAVKSNTDFAFDLYRRLAAKKKDDNLFFSPYSISGALAMTSEGARGETAGQMGEVLRFPPQCRRVGKEAQLIPWKTVLVHTGYQTLNQKLHSSQLDPKYKETKTKIDTLEAEYFKLDSKAVKLGNELFGFGFGDSVPKDHQAKKREYNRVTQRRDQIGKEIEQLSKQISLYELRVANAIWGEKTYPFKQSYVKTIEKHYKTGGMYPVDFVNDFAGAREKINGWCAEQTNNRIKEILPQLPPNQGQSMRLMLTNAIYFKADWNSPFDVKSTKNLDFTLADGSRVKTPIMNAPSLHIPYGAFQSDGSRFATPTHADPKRKDGLYPDSDGFSMVQLPYRGNDVAMLVIAPNHHQGLGAIERQLNSDRLDRWVKQMSPRDVNVFLPRFKQETSYELKNTLVEMGMVDAFDPSRADFSGMSESTDQPLYIGMVKHKAFVEVNEKGTEAAAVTGIGLMLGGAPQFPPFTPEFRADRPFLFVIRDVSSGTILFMGRVSAPNQKQ